MYPLSVLETHTSLRKDSMLYHICIPAEWAEAQQQGHHSPASLAKEGFVHASTKAQVVATANRYYRGHSTLFLLEIEEAAVSSSLRWEKASPTTEETHGQSFPHIYQVLPLDAIVRAHEWRATETGEFVWLEGW